MGLDLSVVGVNATSAITENFEILMAADDHPQLCKDLLEIVINAGLAGANLDKVRLAIRDSFTRNDPLLTMKHYIKNFMLKGMGMGVDQGRRPSRRRAS